MEPGGSDTNDFCVNEGTFWHSNMDLYYGYQAGEVVEVEHESNKYWLATIEYSFRHLILLKWIGNYGEFWVETSSSQKRLFPPGHHLQTQVKSQFILEQPTKVLIQPSLYNPKNDPYAEIKTVEDLLAHEFEPSNTDTFGNQSNVSPGEAASLVLAKCKTKIDYDQEDVDELEAALQSINEIEPANNSDLRVESPLTSSSINKQNDDKKNSVYESLKKIEPTDKVHDNNGTSGSVKSNAPCNPDDGCELEKKCQKNELDKPIVETKDITPSDNDPDANKELEANINLCKKLQESAIRHGKYFGIGNNENKVYYTKPKQFFDLGGANHERVFVPGTLVEVSHQIQNEEGLVLCHWFAIVIKNLGGRLTLRWFICDEPKFKQGRLELKSLKSELVSDDEDNNPNATNCDGDETRLISPKGKITAKDITFCLHFCDLSIYTISHAAQAKRPYAIPKSLREAIESMGQSKELTAELEKIQETHVLDSRRMNLDKDRPIIDHILSVARWSRPKYLNLTFAPRDKDSRREVLVSSPKMTKLFRATVKREVEPEIYEIHSLEPINGEILKFLYPCSEAYCVLPLDWAINNKECLSVDPSRNPTPIHTPSQPLTPMQTDEPMNEDLTTASDKEQQSEDKNQSTSNESSTDPKDDELNQLNLIKSEYILMTEIPKAYSENTSDMVSVGLEDNTDNRLDPSYWSYLNRRRQMCEPHFKCTLDYSLADDILGRFKVMDQLEVVHPTSDASICLGRIRKVVFPLLWIQISLDSYTVLPFNSTSIYPTNWCETNNHQFISLLPPRKRVSQRPASSQPDSKKRKKNSNHQTSDVDSEIRDPADAPEHFDVGALSDKQLDIDQILSEKSMYIRIYFNHKCFTGPSLSKGKICSLPQYVGPGPLRLVMEEVVTKVISVAYVPPRILNDLSSKSFEELLVARNLLNTVPMEFKAKYQKRVQREDIPVCISPDDVALYCECLCEHLKCCYNLFGPNLYDGDDCPGHCRALTKSNKFMKRATYYREKARLGEFTNDSSSNKKAASEAKCNGSSTKSSKPRYVGRGSSDSTSSSASRAGEQPNSRSSSALDDAPNSNELKENLGAVDEEDAAGDSLRPESRVSSQQQDGIAAPVSISSPVPINSPNHLDIGCRVNDFRSQDVTGIQMASAVMAAQQTINNNNNYQVLTCRTTSKWPADYQSEFSMIELGKDVKPEDWTVDEVAKYLDYCRLGRFKPHMISEGVDGQALLLLDKSSIREHIQSQTKLDYSAEEVGKFCRFVEFIKSKAETSSHSV